jgi:homoserine kinase
MLHLKIPATAANLGPGYDTFGMALAYYNYMKVIPDNKFSLKIIGEGAQHLTGNKENLIALSAKAVYKMTGGGEMNFRIEAKNNIPISRGLGSSAAAITGGIMAANYTLGNPLSQKQMLDLAIKIEGHPDNAAPAILGGFVISCQNNPDARFIKINVTPALKAVVIIPSFRLSTGKSRKAVPEQIPLKDAVFNLRHGVMMALSLQNADLSAFADALKDKLHQPYRFPLIRGAEYAIKKGLEAGALGCVLSGSGSSLIAFTAAEKRNEHIIGKAMVNAFRKNRVGAIYLGLNADNHGIRATGIY